MSGAERVVVDNPALQRYELRAGDQVDGVVDYRPLEDGVLAITHVEVRPELRGHGVSAPFLDDVLDRIDAAGLRIVPRCGYAAAHVAGQPRRSHMLAR